MSKARLRQLLLGGFLLMAGGAAGAAGGLYVCVDEHGVTSYQDHACPARPRSNVPGPERAAKVDEASCSATVEHFFSAMEKHDSTTANGYLSTNLQGTINQDLLHQSPFRLRREDMSKMLHVTAQALRHYDARLSCQTTELDAEHCKRHCALTETAVYVQRTSVVGSEIDFTVILEGGWLQIQRMDGAVTSYHVAGDQRLIHNDGKAPAQTSAPPPPP